MAMKSRDSCRMPTLVHNRQHLIAVLPPALDDGDPCQQCPGWLRFWHDKLQRPYPFPILVLRRHFCDWWSNAAVERIRRTVCRNLCKRTFRHWESLWAYTSMADMCFEYADYGSDGTGD